MFVMKSPHKRGFRWLTAPLHSALKRQESPGSWAGLARSADANALHGAMPEFLQRNRPRAANIRLARNLRG
jgi:hypothetical protein